MRRCHTTFPEAGKGVISSSTPIYPASACSASFVFSLYVVGLVPVHTRGLRLRAVNLFMPWILWSPCIGAKDSNERSPSSARAPAPHLGQT